MSFLYILSVFISIRRSRIFKNISNFRMHQMISSRYWFENLQQQWSDNFSSLHSLQLSNNLLFKYNAFWWSTCCYLIYLLKKSLMIVLSAIMLEATNKCYSYIEVNTFLSNFMNTEIRLLDLFYKVQIGPLYFWNTQYIFGIPDLMSCKWCTNTNKTICWRWCKSILKTIQNSIYQNSLTRYCV